MVALFAVPVFFICFRECLETSIIVSVLLSFMKQTLGPERDPIVYKKLKRQVWMGVALGLLLCIVIGAGMIGAFYGLSKDVFAKTEYIWEGVFGLLASVVITIMGAALLRVSKLQDKWRVKLAQALESKELTKRGTAGTRFKQWAEKYAMFILPFITVLREGLEAVVFIGGVSLSIPASSFPLAVVCGLACGAIIGYLIYRGGNQASLQYFLICSTGFLYLVAAGLFSKGVGYFESYAWNKILGSDADALGSGPGTYDIRTSVWHVNCCSPELNGGGGWGIFNALLGWTNSATYGTVISYNVYWIVVISGFVAMKYNENHGHWPMLKPKSKDEANSEGESQTSSQRGSLVEEILDEKKGGEANGPVSTAVHEIPV